MDDDFLDDVPASGTPSTRHALLVAALLHLMSHYTTRERDEPCVKLASVIERHLNALARLPDADPLLRATCEQLSSKWASLVDSALPAPAQPKRPLLARFLRQAGSKADAAPAVA